MDSLRGACWRIGIAICSPDVLACGCFPHPVWVACPPVRAYRQVTFGIFEQHFHGSHQENDGSEHRKDRRVHRPYHPGFGQCSGYGGGDAGHLFLFGCVADGGLSGGRGD